MKPKILMTCALIATAMFAIGCSRQPTIPAAEFGDTVRDVMESQIHDYEAAIHPSPDAIEGGDPYRLDAAVNAHRGDVTRPQEVKQPVTISIGN